MMRLTIYVFSGWAKLTNGYYVAMGFGKYITWSCRSNALDYAPSYTNLFSVLATIYSC